MLTETQKGLLRQLSPFLDEGRLNLIRREVRKEVEKKGKWTKAHEQELEKFLADIKKKK